MAGRAAAFTNTLPVVLPLLHTYWGLNAPNLPFQSKIKSCNECIHWHSAIKLTAAQRQSREQKPPCFKKDDDVVLILSVSNRSKHQIPLLMAHAFSSYLLHKDLWIQSSQDQDRDLYESIHVERRRLD